MHFVLERAHIKHDRSISRQRAELMVGRVRDLLYVITCTGRNSMKIMVTMSIPFLLAT